MWHVRLIMMAYLTLGCHSTTPGRDVGRDGAVLMAWAGKEGASFRFNLIPSHAHADDLTAVTATTVEPGEAWCEVPTRLALCPRIATETFRDALDFLEAGEASTVDTLAKEESRKGSDARMKARQDSWHWRRSDMLLAAALLLERHRGSDSLWRHYLPMLPPGPVGLHLSAMHPDDVTTILEGLVHSTDFTSHMTLP